MSDAPFKVGQRVRMKPQLRHLNPQMKSFVGTVIGVKKCRHSEGVWVSIRRDGLSKHTRTSYLIWPNEDPDWELVPTVDLTFDQVAQALADAVKLGDTNAALPLADRVFELCGGTPGA